MHAMQGNDFLSGAQIKEKLINSSLTAVDQFKHSLYCDAYELGKALHYLHDSRTPSHAKVAGGVIIQFYNYAEQDPYEHAQGDKKINISRAIMLTKQFLLAAFDDLNVGNDVIRGFYKGTPQAGGGGPYAK